MRSKNTIQNRKMNLICVCVCILYATVSSQSVAKEKLAQSKSVNDAENKDVSLSGNCNIVISLVNSNYVNINNASPCPDHKNRLVEDSKECLETTKSEYASLYSKGLLTIPLFPIFSILNSINKNNAENEANQQYKACMEARGYIIDGYGMRNFENGNVYQGNWKDGLFDGEGTFRWKGGGSYEGEWKDGRKNGRGFDIYSDGETYKGQFVNDTKNGYGILSWPDGRRFEGTFENDRPNGRGLFIAVDGERFEGGWINGCYKDAGRWAAINQNAALCR